MKVHLYSTVGPNGVVVSVLVSHAVDLCSNPGSTGILSGTLLVDLFQFNVTFHYQKTSILSLWFKIFVHVMKLEINARSYEFCYWIYLFGTLLFTTNGKYAEGIHDNTKLKLNFPFYLFQSCIQIYIKGIQL